MKLQRKTTQINDGHLHGLHCKGCAEIYQAGYSAAIISALHKLNQQARIEAGKSWDEIVKNSENFDKHLETLRRGLR